MRLIERRRLRDLTLLVASSLTVMAGTPVAPALPTMQAAFRGHSGAELKVRLMLTLPALCIALIAPASGWVVDRFGRRPLLLWGTVLYAIAGSSGLYLDSLDALLVGRAVLGFAVAAIMTAAVTLIGDYFTGQARHRFVGFQAAFMSFGGMLFLLAGGALAELSWRGPFAIYLLALVVVPMVLLSIDEPERTPPVVSRARGDKATGGATVGLPATPIGIIGVIYVTAFFGMAALYAVPVQLPFHLERLSGANSLFIGAALAVMTLFSTISSVAYSRVKAHLSFHGVVALMLLGVSLGFWIVALAGTYGVVLAGLVIAGLGLGMLMPNLNLWLMLTAPEHRRGRLVGGLTMAFFLGQFASPLMLEPLKGDGGTAQVFTSLAAAMFLAMLGFAGYALVHRSRS